MEVALSLAAALSLSVATLMASPPRRWARRRLRVLGVELEETPVRASSPWWFAGGAALATAVVVDGALGWLLAAVVGYSVHRWRRSRATQQDRLDQTRRALAMPLALDLLSAGLVVGAAQHEALSSVAACLPGSLSRDLRVVAGAMTLGADADEAWSLVDAPDLITLRAVFTRVGDSGASAAPLLTVLAEQHRHRARAAAIEASRSLGVRLTGPLGLCFLPSFVLIAIVPLVVSLLPFDL